MSTQTTRKTLEKRQVRLQKQQEVLALRLQKQELEAKIRQLTKRVTK